MQSNWRPILIIVAGLIGWGLLLALGAYLQIGDSGAPRDVRKFWIVIGCVAGFLAFWGLALAGRARRLARTAAPRSMPQPPPSTPGGQPERRLR